MAILEMMKLFYMDTSKVMRKIMFYTKFVIFCGILISSQVFADQINALRFKSALSSDSFYVEDGLDGQAGVGLDYKGFISLSYEQADNLFSVVRNGGQNKVNELVLNLKRFRLSGGHFILPRLFIGVTVPLDNINSLQPFNTKGGNDIDNLSYQKSDWILGDVTVTSKYRLFDLSDSWNWTILANITAPTGDQKFFNTDDSIGGGLGFGFTKYFHPLFKLYGNLSYQYANNAKIRINDQFREFDATQRLQVALGINHRIYNRFSWFLETASQIGFPFNDFQNPLVINGGVNFYAGPLIFNAGYGLEEFLDNDHSEKRLFGGIKFQFNQRHRTTPRIQQAQLIEQGVHRKTSNKINSQLVNDLIALGKRIHFATNQSDIIPIYHGFLDHAAEIIKKNRRRIKKIKIEGHSDSRGNETQNKKLAMARAQSVKKYFMEKHGLSHSLFEAISMSESSLLTKEVDPYTQRLNRRVEFYVYEAK